MAKENIADIINKMELTPEETKHILTQLRKPEQVRKSYDHFYDSKKVKFRYH